MVRDEIIGLLKQEFALDWKKPSDDIEILGEYRSYGEEYFSGQDWTECDMTVVLDDPKVLVELRPEWFIYYWPSFVIGGLNSLSERPFVHSDGHSDTEWINLDWIRFFRKSSAFHQIPSTASLSLSEGQLLALMFGFCYLVPIYIHSHDVSANQEIFNLSGPVLTHELSQADFHEAPIGSDPIGFEKVTEDIFSYIRLAGRSRK